MLSCIGKEVLVDQEFVCYFPEALFLIQYLVVHILHFGFGDLPGKFFESGDGSRIEFFIIKR